MRLKNNELKQNLKHLAEKLPQPTPQKISGQKLLSLRIAKNPKDIDPNATYEVKGTYINHYRRMKKAYQSGGDKAVIDYIEQFKTK